MLNAGGIETDGVVGAETLPPDAPRVGIVVDNGVFLSPFKAAIDLPAPAMLPAILAAAEIVLIVTHGCPNVTGDAATAFALAIPVFDIIREIAPTWSTTILAIANSLLSLPNALNTFCKPFKPLDIVAKFASLADCSACIIANLSAKAFSSIAFSLSAFAFLVSKSFKSNSSCFNLLASSLASSNLSVFILFASACAIKLS